MAGTSNREWLPSSRTRVVFTFAVCAHERVAATRQHSGGQMIMSDWWGGRRQTVGYSPPQPWLFSYGHVVGNTETITSRCTTLPLQLVVNTQKQVWEKHFYWFFCNFFPFLFQASWLRANTKVGGVVGALDRIFVFRGQPLCSC